MNMHSFKHFLRGRRIDPNEAAISFFEGFSPYRSVQYLTTDGETFTSVPLKGGGRVFSLDYASHAKYKTRRHTRRDIIAERLIFRLKLGVKGKTSDHVIIFQDIKQAANLLTNLKRETITYPEIIALVNSKDYPVIGKRGWMDEDLRQS